MGLGKGRQTDNYIRHGTTTLFAALDSATGFVKGERYKRRRSKEFVTFLKEIHAAVEPRLNVNLVMDHYATHKTREVRSWLARRPHWRVC